MGKNFVAPEVAAGMGDYTQLGTRTHDAIPGARLIGRAPDRARA